MAAANAAPTYNAPNGAGVGGTINGQVGLGMMAGPAGVDAAAFLVRRSSGKAAAAGRALLMGGEVAGSGALKAPPPSSANFDHDGQSLGGFSDAQLAAELEKRAKSTIQTRTSVSDFLGSAAELSARASVDALLANPFQGSGSRSNIFANSANASRNNLLSAAVASGSRSDLLNSASQRVNSASDLFNAAFSAGSSRSDIFSTARNSFHKNSTSNLLNAARGSFHNNSTNNLLNAASYARKSSASNLLDAGANSYKNRSTSNLLNALASSGALRNGSTSNLLNAARAAKRSSAGLGLESFLAARADSGRANETRDSGASLQDILGRKNSVDFQSRVSHLMGGSEKPKNWSSSAGIAGIGGSSARLGGGSSRSNLANLKMSMLNNGGSSSVFGNATFGGEIKPKNKETRRLELAKLLTEEGMDAESAFIAAGKFLEKEENMEKEAMLQNLQTSGGLGGTGALSNISEYLMQQKMAASSENAMGDNTAPTGASDEVQLRMLELKRKFFSSQESPATGIDYERTAKRPK